MTDEVRVGADVGGTFTDVVTVENGRLHVDKVPSTPDAPEEGVLDGLESAPVDLPAVEFLGHGTTVATNAVLEGEWADTALVTTAGFRDALEIGRQDRPELYDFRAEKPEVPVPRDRRYEVPERLDERGEVLEPLDEDAVRALADDLDAEAVAVALLFSFENDDHERRVRELLREAGVDASFSLSAEVLPEIREYERTLATCLNAGLKPVMDSYLGRLESGVRDRGAAVPLSVMQSNGGLADADAARERPVHTLLSGPAAGVKGATHVAGRAGYDDLLTMDMGGTSCDVSLVEGGDPVVSTDVTVGDYPVGVPMVDVHTVGSGGGSVAWIDEGGALRVGPQSAGADPGPACYGRGGTRPTVTDAHVVLGRIDPEAFLEGVAGAEDAAREALTSVADPLDATVREAAEGVLDVANANLSRALRVVSVERGHDPREFALVAYGGAGPLHATALARDLDVPEVVVPRAAGVLSALGLLASDRVYDRSTSHVRPWDGVSAADLRATFERLEREGRERHDDPDFERSVDLRYAGQSFDLRVPVPGDLDADAMAGVAERFHERHERRYGHASPDEPLELAAVRLRTRVPVDPPDLRPAPVGDGVDDAVREHREVVLDGAVHEAPAYDRARLPTGGEFDGPAVVEGDASTAVLRPGDSARVDGDDNLVVEVGE